MAAATESLCHCENASSGLLMRVDLNGKERDITITVATIEYNRKYWKKLGDSYEDALGFFKDRKFRRCELDTECDEKNLDIIHGTHGIFRFSVPRLKEIIWDTSIFSEMTSVPMDTRIRFKSSEKIASRTVIFRAFCSGSQEGECVELVFSVEGRDIIAKLKMYHAQRIAIPGETFTIARNNRYENLEVCAMMETENIAKI